MLVVDKETFEFVLPKQCLYSGVVDILHLVTIGSMQEMDDGKLGRVGFERIAQELECFVKSHLRRHDAMIGVDVVLVHTGTQVESSDANVPLLGDVNVLCTSITIAKDAYQSTKTIPCCCIVCTRNGKGCHISVIGKSAHPVSCMERNDIEEDDDYENKAFHPYKIPMMSRR